MKSMLRAVAREALPRVWTVQRKLLGNVLPLLCGMPCAIGAVFAWTRGLEWDAIGLAAASLVVAAASLNWLGLAGNAAMRRMLAARLKPPAGSIFVGCSRPGYFDLLDPHEDLGFLQIETDRLRVSGELAAVEILRSREIEVSYAFNPHTLFGLGRWLKIRGESSNGPIGVLIEPRELGSLRSNRALGARLMAQLDEWRLR